MLDKHTKKHFDNLSDINKFRKTTQSALGSRNSFSDKARDEIFDKYHRKILSRDCVPPKPDRIMSSEVHNLSSANNNDIISFHSSLKPQLVI